MNPLNIIDSWYCGVPYKKTLNTQLELIIGGDFEDTRFPSQPLVYNPYHLDFETYRGMLKRCEIIMSSPSTSLRFKSPKEDWDSVIKSYSNGEIILSEPLLINSSDLFYPYDDKVNSISPLGLLALVFRKSYGNEKFKQYVNTELLRNDYYKISSKTSPSFYVYKGYDLGMNYMTEVRDLLEGSDTWGKVKDFFIKSPYIFSWRD